MGSAIRDGFDPAGTSNAEDGLFGLPCNEAPSRLVLLPVPWDVTTSYGQGTARGPEALLAASDQLDLFTPEYGRAYENGFFMRPLDPEIIALNSKARTWAKKVIASASGDSDDNPKPLLEKVNAASAQLNRWLAQNSRELLEKGKVVGTVGGDHSVPFGAVQSLSQHLAGDFSILHIDAHFDLRRAYQGFEHSHASILFNIMHSDFKPKSLVQVGLRDFCQDEYELARAHPEIHFFLDAELQSQLFAGQNWQTLSEKILEPLGQNVYISVDIDGLDPSLCPHTGTPVPGGLTFQQLSYLLYSLSRSGRRIVGFDLVEVAPSPDPRNEWDANVGARLLFQLCSATALSQGWPS